MVFGTTDFVFLPVFLLLTWLMARRYSASASEEEASWIRRGLWAKVGGAIILGYIYQYYYGGGDTLAYYAGARAWTNYLWDDPAGALGFLVSGGRPELAKVREYHRLWDYWFIFRSGSQEIPVIKVAGVLNLLGLNTYTGTAVWFAILAFPGQIALFRTFNRQCPELVKQNAWVVFLIPSVVFWGAGILKDTITFAAVGWLVYAIDQLVGPRKRVVASVLMIVIAGYVLAVVKGYILVAMIPAALLWITNSFKTALPSKFLQRIITPFVLAVSVAFTGVFINSVSASLGRYSVDNLEGVATATQEWHTVVSADGSGYSLGEVSFTPAGMLAKAPAAINVTLFRPYLWEASGVVVLITAVESLLVLILTLRLLLRAGPKGIWRGLGHPFVLFCVVFALIFAFAVGFTAYNFGALARYKIPLLPFYVGALFMMGYLAKGFDNEMIRKLED